MTYELLITNDPWQVFTIDAVIDEESIHAQFEFRYLPAPNQWVLSLWDHASGELLVNMIPIICSYDIVNDLFAPFRYLRQGKGVGALMCMRGMDEVSTTDPAKGNLTEFRIIWGDING